MTQITKNDFVKNILKDTLSISLYKVLKLKNKDTKTEVSLFSTNINISLHE